MHIFLLTYSLPLAYSPSPATARSALALSVEKLPFVGSRSYSVKHQYQLAYGLQKVIMHIHYVHDTVTYTRHHHQIAWHTIGHTWLSPKITHFYVCLLLV